MIAQAIAVATAMVAAINAAEGLLPEGITAQLRFNPKVARQDLGTLHVLVVPAASSDEPLSRGKTSGDIEVLVCVMKAASTDAETAPVLAQADAINDALKMRTFAGAGFRRMATTPLFDLKDLTDNQQCTCTTRFTFFGST